MSNYDQYPASQITMTRAERQRLEALKRRRMKRGRETILGKIFFIFLLLIASVFAFALIRSIITGEPPQLAGRQFYIVASGSMEPVIARGSLLVVKPVDPAELKRADVITFIDPADPARVVSHRIMEVLAGGSFITRGDANNMDDPEPVPAENILGKAEYIIPYAGYVLDFAQSTKGLITMILIPSLLIVVFEFRRLLQYVSMIEKEKNESSVL